MANRTTETPLMHFAIYSGDAKNDGAIDTTDASIVDNDAFNFAIGYFPADVMGDDTVDASDASFVENNAVNFVEMIRPLRANCKLSLFPEGTASPQLSTSNFPLSTFHF